MEVKCINPRFVHVHWGTDANGRRTPKRIRVGDTFPVKKIPPEWAGMVVPVDGSSIQEKVEVTNPAESAELADLKAEYKEQSGKPAHYSWDEAKLREKLSELGEE